MKMRFNKVRKWLAALLALVLLAAALPASADSGFAAVVTAKSMALYANASLTQQFATLSQRDVVHVNAFSGNVAHVTNKYGVSGYAKVSDMVAVDAIAREAYVNENTRVYEDYNTNSNFTTLAKGTAVDVIAVAGEWALIEKNSIGGYTYARYLTYTNGENAGGVAPTAAPTAAPTTAPAPTDSIPGIVVRPNTPVYANPSTSAQQIGVLVSDARVNVCAVQGEWALIELSGNYGYCQVINLGPAEVLSEYVTGTVLQNCPVYSDPRTNSTQYFTLTAGSKVNIHFVAGDWAFVSQNGNYGYCASACVTEGSAPTAAPTTAPAPTDSIPGIVVRPNTPVYANPSTSAQQIGVLVSDARVNVCAVQGEWALIELSGNYGYCQVINLGPAEVLSEYVTGTVLQNCPVYSDPRTNSTQYFTLTAGSKVNIHFVAGDWAFVSQNGNYGYCASACVTEGSAPTAAPTTAPAPTDSIPGIVVRPNTPVYANPSTSAQQIGVLVSDARVNVCAVQGEWALIELSGNYGYCQVINLGPEEVLSEYVTGTVLQNCAVYSDPRTNSTQYFTLTSGSKVNIHFVAGDWAFVSQNGNYGYCASACVTEGSAPTATPDPTLPVSIPGIVVTETLDVYEQPSTSANKLGTILYGTIVNVMGISGDWAYIELNGHYGFCAVAALMPYGGTIPTPTPSQTPGGTTPGEGYYWETFSATVIASGVKFYASDSTSAASVDVPLGTNVTVGAYNTQWAYVDISGVKGFIQISGLSRGEYGELKSGSSGSAVQSLETALLMLGYLDSNPGTSYTSYTEAAVRLFQQACGMSQTGIADQATQRVLYGGHAPSSDLLNHTYSSGDSGTNVGRIQLRLLALGYLSKTASVDGDYGTNTANAVRLFQQANGLTVNGSVDSSTLRLLYSPSAAPLPDGQMPADQGGTGGGGKEPDGTGQSNNSTTMVDGLKSTTSSYSSSMSDAEKYEYVIYVAQNQLGKPYVYGATGTSSYDCSGLTYYSFRKIGVTLPRTAQSQGYDDDFRQVSSVSDLQRGDLVFFNTVSDSDQCDHTGIYLGDGWFIHASSGSGRVVVSTLASGYYNRVFSWGRRVL